MVLKKPLTLDEQINRLIEHGMIVNDRDWAREILSYVSYYRLTGYALQFRNPSCKDIYLENTTFESVYQIYLFDAQLRNILLRYLEYVEIRYRTQIAYHFSVLNCSKVPHDQHYDESYFRNKKSHEIFLNKLRQQLNYYKDTKMIQHHIVKYSKKLPIWAMVEIISFSNLSYFFKSMRRADQDVISNEAGVQTAHLINHLHCMAILRNACAHGSRLYNSNLKKKIKLDKSFLKRYPDIANNSLFAYILVLGKHIPSKGGRKQFVDDLRTALTRYNEMINLDLLGFPMNYEHILTEYIEA